MMHVKQIREIVDQGKADEAHAALDQLLALGPSNTEALKLRAQLHEFEGRFADEARVWDRVAQIDREDPDAQTFHLRKQVEDREHFYFTDDIPGGGRKFMAYPRHLVNTSALGLMGCIAFLLSTRLAVQYPVINDPVVMLGLFGFFVMLPWVSIVASYFTAIKAIAISPNGFSVSTRIRAHAFAWPDVEKVCLARSIRRDRYRLTLVVIPKDRSLSPVEIDLNQGSTAIRARSYLVKEITRVFAEPEYTTREALGLDGRKVASF